MAIDTGDAKGPSVEVGEMDGESASISLSTQGISGEALDLSDDEASSSEFLTTGGVKTTAKKEAAEEGDEPTEEAAPEGDEPKEEQSEAPPPDADPGEWNPEDPEVVSKFDTRYWKGEGAEATLNLAAFNPELEASLARIAALPEAERTGIKPDISAGGRAYVKERLGLSDEAIDHHIAGVLALQSQATAQADAAVYSVAGNKETFEAAYEWAKQNYTPAQRARWEAARTGNDTASINEQVEILVARFKASGGKVTGPSSEPDAKATPRPGPAPRRPASPRKSATSGTNTPAPKAAQKSDPGAGEGVKPYGTEAEWRADLKSAGQDTRKLDAIQLRLEATPAKVASAFLGGN